MEWWEEQVILYNQRSGTEDFLLKGTLLLSDFLHLLVVITTTTTINIHLFPAQPWSPSSLLLPRPLRPGGGVALYLRLMDSRVPVRRGRGEGR